MHCYQSCSSHTEETERGGTGLNYDRKINSVVVEGPNGIFQFDGLRITYSLNKRGGELRKEYGASGRTGSRPQF